MKRFVAFLICAIAAVSVASAEGVKARYDTLISEKTWNAIDETNSGYATADDFLAYTRETIQHIAEFVKRPDWHAVYGDSVIIEYRMTDGPSHAEGGYRAVNNPIPITYLNQPLFEKGMAPIAHETTHIMCPKYSLLSLREGLASYCHERFGGNPTVFSFNLPVHEHARYLKNTQPAMFEETLGRIGDPLGEISCAEGEARVAFYTISHSLTKYIIETYGIDAYMLLYESDPYGVSFEDVLGISLDVLKQEWLVYVDSLPRAMSEQEINDALGP